MPEVSILVKAKDEASKILGGIGKSAQGLGSMFGSLGLIAPISLAAVSAGVIKLAFDAAALGPVKVTFDNLTASIDSTSDAMLKKLRPASMGIVSDANLMKSANKLMSMGLADSEEKAAKLTEMAIKLGTAMGVDATTSMENFALMLANQSIPRLDTFGISSGKVRERINELMEANKSLTREQAFMNAVMEQGEEAMKRVGDVSDTEQVKIAKLRATWENLRKEWGEELLPILGDVVDGVDALTEMVLKNDRASETWSERIEERIIRNLNTWGDMIPGLEWASEKLRIKLQQQGFTIAGVGDEMEATYKMDYIWRDAIQATTNALEDREGVIDSTTEAYKRQRAAMAEATMAEQEQQRRIGLLFPEPTAIKGIMDEIRKEIMATDPRIASAHAALDVEKRTYEESLAALEANEEAKKLLYEDAQKRLEETRAGMHGIPGAYDVQAIVSESLLPYKEEWESAHKVVEGAEEAHIDRMKALEGTYAGTVEGALTPALATWNKYLRTVDEANKMAAESHARAIIDAWDGAMPTAYDVLAQMVEDGDVKLGDLDKATGELMRNMLDDYGSMPPAVREAMGGIRRSIIDDTLDPAIEKAKDLGSELNNLDGRKVDIYVTYYYEHMGELPPAGVPTPEPTGAALLEKLRL